MSLVSRFVIGLGLVSGAAILAACGSPPPPQAPEVAPPPPPVQHAPQMKSSQELGSIDEAATNHTFESLQTKLLDCQRSGMSRVEYLAGDARFFLRIGQDGAVRWAYLEDSTLGDRDTEKCMVQVLTAAHWPQPDGGEAEVQKSISFDSGDARPPASWRPDKVASVLATEGNDALKCKRGATGTFKVTAYVEPGEGGEGGGKGHKRKHEPHGKVLAVGVAPPNKDGEAQADCIVDAVKDWKMPSPGGYAAKVTFTL